VEGFVVKCVVLRRRTFVLFANIFTISYCSLDILMEIIICFSLFKHILDYFPRVFFMRHKNHV